MRTIFLVSIATALGIGCSSPVSFKTDVQPIIGTCMADSCHTGSAQSMGCGSGESGCVTFPYATIVNVKASECADGRMLVKPGDSANSYLIQKLRGINMCTCCQMPVNKDLPPAMVVPLSADQIQKVADWIDQGAPNN